MKIYYIFVTLLAVAAFAIVHVCYYHSLHKERRIITRLKANARPCYNSAFKDYLIVLNFNTANYQYVNLTKELYTDVFGVILSCGPSATDDSKQPDIPFDDGHWFYYRYLCLTKAMERYPNYKGYIYSNDDVVLNWWNLLERDPTKVWQGAKINWDQQIDQPILVKWWIWWEKTNGLEACQHYYNILKHSNDKIHQKALAMSLVNGENTLRCAKGKMDMFYVPARLRTEYMELSRVANESKLMLELAVGTIFGSLDDKDNFENLNGVYIRTLNLKENSASPTLFWRLYNTTIPFIHPIKFLNDDSEVTRVLFKNYVLNYKNMLLC